VGRKLVVAAAGLLLATGALSGCINLVWAPCRCSCKDGKCCAWGECQAEPTPAEPTLAAPAAPPTPAAPPVPPAEPEPVAPPPQPVNPPAARPN
jgi:hypothetical protein